MNVKMSAGDRVQSMCTKCKDVTSHAVVAMVGDQVAKVQCLTCKGFHAYRPPAGSGPEAKGRAGGGTTKKSATPRPASGAAKVSAASRAASALLREWEDSVGKAREQDASPYSMTACFATGELVLHSSFGLGRVIETTKPDKMRVLFQDGVKSLRCKL